MNSMFQSPIWGFNAANSLGNLLGTKLANLDFTSPTDIAGNPVTKPANDMYTPYRKQWQNSQDILGTLGQPVSMNQGIPSSGFNAKQSRLSPEMQTFFNQALPQNLQLGNNPTATTQPFYQMGGGSSVNSLTLDNPTYPKDLAKTFEGANGVGVADPVFNGSTQIPSLAGSNNFNANGNIYSNFLQDPTNSIGFNPASTTGAGDGLSGLFGVTDWANKGVDPSSKNYMSSGDILGGLGSIASMGMGAYGMFTSLDQGQQQLDDTSRRTDLLESKYNEELRNRSAIRAQNLAASNA